MRMYVANLTQQVHGINYRIPGQTGVRSQFIPIGGCIQLSGDLSSEETDSVVGQLSQYGLVRVDELGSFKGRKAPYCWDTKPIPINKIRDGIRKNEGILLQEGRDFRQQAAVVINNAIDQEMSHLSREIGANIGLEKLEVTVVEDTKGVDEPGVNEGVRVDKRAEGPRKRR